MVPFQGLTLVLQETQGDGEGWRAWRGFSCGSGAGGVVEWGVVSRVTGIFVIVVVLLVQVGLGQARREPAPNLPPVAESFRRYQKEAKGLLEAELKFFFPAIVDTKGGGFHETKPSGSLPLRHAGTTVVYQARTTWAAAEVARRRPEFAKEYTEYARHGAKYLQEVMWDKANGGVYWACDSAGRPQVPTGAEKHVYGMALAIRALAHVYLLTGDKQCLQLAQDADEWLVQRGLDKEHGGYYQAFTPQGQVIFHPRQTGTPSVKVDKIGTPYGCKSSQVQIHLMEAVVALHRAEARPGLIKQIRDLYEDTRDRALLPTGQLARALDAAWTPMDRGGDFGMNLEASVLLIDTARALQLGDDPRVVGLSRKIVDAALDRGWDAEMGGFWSDPQANEKRWWVQAEGARALLILYGLSGAEAEGYWSAFQQQWHFIRRYMTDQQSRGWFATVGADGMPTGRNMIQPIKTCDQTVRALLDIEDIMAILAGDQMPATQATQAATRATTMTTTPPVTR